MSPKTRKCLSNPVGQPLARALGSLSRTFATLAFVVFCAATVWSAQPSTRDLATSLADSSFDPKQCFRVRNIRLEKEDLRIYLTDGYLIFAKPVEGRRLAAYFYAEHEAGDGEILLVPPDAAERTTLARFSGAPTLDEHFRGGLLLFTDQTGEQLAQCVAEEYLPQL
jgi:hypothetical protein